MSLRKNTLALIFSMCVFGITASAQIIELTPFGGYMLNGRVNEYWGRVDFEDAGNFGAVLSVETFTGGFAEFSYNRNVTTAFVLKNIGAPSSQEIVIEHYQIGHLVEVNPGETTPFGMISVGASRYFNRNTFNLEEWRFSIQPALGAKIMFSENIGIRLQARFIMPLEFTGIGLGCGIGTGGASCGGGATFRIPAVHADFTGGLIFRFGAGTQSADGVDYTN